VLGGCWLQQRDHNIMQFEKLAKHGKAQARSGAHLAAMTRHAAKMMKAVCAVVAAKPLKALTTGLQQLLKWAWQKHSETIWKME